MHAACCALAALIATVLLAPGPAAKADFLDDYLHNIERDQASPWRTKDLANEALTSPHAFGQTFVTGPEVEEIYQVAVQVPHYNEQWGEGTALVMSLYDSPAKQNKLGEFEMKYEWRSWEDMVVVFPLKVRAEPGRAYYFELTAEGGNGQIGPILKAAGDYPDGRGYIDGTPQDFDFAFETYVHNRWDRDQTYQEAFAMFDLDGSGMEAVKSCVERRDWEAAARALVAHFEGREQFRAIAAQSKGGAAQDLTIADLAAEMKILDSDGNVLSLGPNWNHLKWWPTRGGVGLTREGIRKHLAAGYSKTRDSKYARAWNDLLKAVLTDLPSPIKAGVIPADAQDVSPVNPGGIAGGSMWSGLACGARLAHEFYYYAVFADAQEFAWDVRAAFIINLGDMADVLAKQKGGGNWATQMFDHLFYFSTEFPEYARSAKYAELAFKGLLDNMRETLLPDGPIGESAGYQMLVHQQYLDVLDRAESMGLSIPRDILDRIERAIEFHVYSITPAGHRPAFGDALRDSPAKLLKRAADRFGRDDMLWAATAGSEGKRPGNTSVEFPYSKYYVMRSDWSPDALYMCLKNGRYTSHGHFDSLGFELHALGNAIFVDPGIYIYGTPEAQTLVSTRSHNTVCVDGANLHNGGDPNQFFTGNSIDYFSGRGPSYQNLDPSIQTVRRVAFLKPDYWVVSDLVEGSGVHKIDLRFHYADMNATLHGTTQIARSTHPDGGNVAVIPVDAAIVSSALEEYYTAFVHEKKEPALALAQSAEAALPLRMDNVLYPYLETFAPPKVTRLQPMDASGPGIDGLKIQTAKGADYVIFGESANARAVFANDKPTTRAQCAVVRTDANGSVRGFALIWGSEVTFGRALAHSDRPVAGLDVTYRNNVVTVVAKDAGRSLRVAALGCKAYSANGGPTVPIRTEGDMFRPFADIDDGAVVVDNESASFRVEGQTKGGSVGGDGEVGFTYHWSHVSPGRTGRFEYAADLPKAGLWEVSVFVPRFRLTELTTAARCEVRFRPSGRWARPTDPLVGVIDTSRARDGLVTAEVNMAAGAGGWASLGVYEFGAGSQAHAALLCDAAVGGPVVVADAVKWTLRQGKNH